MKKVTLTGKTDLPFAEKWLAQPHCFFGPEFKQDDAEQIILTPMPGYDAWAASEPTLLDTVGKLAKPLLTREQEFHLFRQLNYCKWQINQTAILKMPMEDREQLIRKWLARMSEVENIIVLSNTRLLFRHAAKKHMLSGMEIADCFNDAYIGLRITIHRFNWQRGTKFSTYLWYGIQYRFTNVYREEQRQTRLPAPRLVSQTENEMQLDGFGVEDEDVFTRRDREAFTRSLFRSLSQRYGHRYCLIVRMIMGMETGQPETFTNTATALGVTKERVRQIHKKALGYMKKIAYSRVQKGKFDASTI